MAGDPHWASVVLAMHMDGANASTVFTDVKGKTVTAVGNAQISTAQSKFGGASALFDGAGDYLTVPSSADFAFGGGDFTIEGFFKFDSGALDGSIGSAVTSLLGRSTLSSGVGSWMLYYRTSVSSPPNTLAFYDSVDGTAATLSVLSSATFNPDVSTWYHLAVCRSGSSLRMFINGVQSGSTLDVTGKVFWSGSTEALRVGADVSNTRAFKGGIDDLRITKGVARYTADFTPPAAAFLEYAGQLAGTVRDDAGALCARTVRAYKRSDGSLIGSAISNAATGVYSFNTQTLDACTLIALDDAAGTAYNALVFDNVIPA